MSTMQRIERPPIHVPQSYPDIPLEQYEARHRAVLDRMVTEGLDVLVIYADREHSGHQEYLCGVAPRFEESVLLLDRSGKRILLLGNENQAYGPHPQLGIEVRLFQDLSPLGQQRESSRPLRSHLLDIGVDKEVSVGCAGWKYFTPGLVADAVHAMDVPAFLVDELRQLAGYDNVRNANHIFLDPEDGIRVAGNDVHQIAQFEYAASVTSNSVWQTMCNISLGVREREIEKWLVSRGLPLSCHNMISFGEKVRRGLSSPSDNRAKLGDAFVIAQGLTGSLTARAGAVAAGVSDLSPNLREFFPEFASNYFEVVATWYEAIRVGAIAGEVFKAVENVRDPELFSFLLNPGHYLSVEEWSNSPFKASDSTRLRSGTALQTDMIPVSQGPFCYANIEDGVVLADPRLRADIQNVYPRLWERLLSRRKFLLDRIGIELHESVMPLSQTPGLFAPYALEPDHVLCRN